MRLDIVPLKDVAQPRTKLVAGLFILTAMLGYAWYADVFHVYTLRDDNGGVILWRGSDAYLFMSVVRRGYRMSLPAYGWAALAQWFNVVPSPTNQRTLLTIMHVTPSGVERHIGKFTGNGPEIPPHFFTPIDTVIYAFSEGTIYRWSDDHFDPATAVEQQKLGGMEHLSSDSDSSVNGWQKRGIGQVAGEAEFSIPIGNDVTLRIHQGNVYKSASGNATVALYKGGQPVQELWQVKAEPRRVSKTEYERSFSADQ